MGKKASATPNSKPVESTTSIDDIFAKPKPKAKPASSVAAKATSKPSGSSSATSADVGSSTGPSKKKRKTKTIPSFVPDDDGNDLAHPSAEGKGKATPMSREVLEVVDPSIGAIAAKISSAKAQSQGSKQDAVAGKKRAKKDVEEDEVFRDSRGEGPRRRTEEGYLIYKEAELKINPEAGGTPLCPFDCECCF